MMTAMEDKDVDWLEKLCEKWVFTNVEQIRVNPIHISYDSRERLKELSLEWNLSFYYRDDSWKEISQIEIDLLKWADEHDE
jgi:hypothetical protein